MKEKLGLFVVTHKDINIDKYPGRKIIYVGNNNFNVDNIKTFKDNSGKNISSQNPIYCELTALYWIWQNYKDAEYVGIEHYRRCFYKGFKIAPIDYLYKKASKVDFLHFQTFYHPFLSEKKRFELYEGKSLFPVLRNAIQKVAPEYLSDFDKQMKSWHCTYCNIFICKKDLFDKYMEFMFSILFEAEKHLNEILPDERSRSIGYMAERLLNTFIEHNHLTHKSSLVVFTKRWKKPTK